MCNELLTDIVMQTIAVAILKTATEPTNMETEADCDTVH